MIETEFKFEVLAIFHSNWQFFFVNQQFKVHGHFLLFEFSALSFQFLLRYSTTELRTIASPIFSDPVLFVSAMNVLDKNISCSLAFSDRKNARFGSFSIIVIFDVSLFYTNKEWEETESAYAGNMDDFAYRCEILAL